MENRLEERIASRTRGDAILIAEPLTLPPAVLISPQDEVVANGVLGNVMDGMKPVTRAVQT